MPKLRNRNSLINFPTFHLTLHQNESLIQWKILQTYISIIHKDTLKAWATKLLVPNKGKLSLHYAKSLYVLNLNFKNHHSLAKKNKKK